LVLLASACVGLSGVLFVSGTGLVSASDPGDGSGTEPQTRGQNDNKKARGQSDQAQPKLRAKLTNGAAPEAKAPNPKMATTDALLHTLEHEIATKELPRNFWSLLEHLTSTMAKEGKELPFFVDVRVFPKLRSEIDGELPPTVFKYPPHPARMSVGAILQMALDQLDGDEATFMIRQRRVEITTRKAAALSNLLKQTFTASFDQQPLEFVLDDLSDISGVSVVIDARARERMRAPITARFRNDVPLHEALRMVTESAGLKLVELCQGQGGARALFVTTPEHAQTLPR
jgi:hypothetical protein